MCTNRATTSPSCTSKAPPPSSKRSSREVWATREGIPVMDGAIAGLVLVGVLVVFAAIIVAKSIALIPQAEAAVIERLGRYSKTVSGQLTLLLPFVDRLRARVELRERVVPFPPQPVITEDNLTVNIDTVVYFQVTSPQAAVYQISNYIVGVEQLT